MLCYSLCSVGFPHLSVGGIFGNHWRLSSTRTLLSVNPFSRAVISKDTKCLFQHISPRAKRIPNQAASFSNQCACPALSHLSMVGWNPFSPQLTRSRPELKSEKIHLNSSWRWQTTTLVNLCFNYVLWVISIWTLQSAWTETTHLQNRNGMCIHLHPFTFQCLLENRKN